MLLEIECSTTSGMSGSPKFIISDMNTIYTLYRLCGVYIGGTIIGQAITFEVFINHEQI